MEDRELPGMFRRWWQENDCPDEVGMPEDTFFSFKESVTGTTPLSYEWDGITITLQP